MSAASRWVGAIVFDGPIFLTGFMATGKSRIGSMLARRLRRPFIDTDQLIEDTSGRSIADIFAQDGEGAFRRDERACVARAAAAGCVVVALGGGAIMQKQIRDLIHRGGVLVCIEAEVDTILERVARKDDRPLLAGLSSEARRQKVCRLLAEREPFYDEANIRIPTTDDEPAEVAVDRLVDLLEHWSASRKSVC